MSLVSNYRTQFNKIIQTSSFDDLLQKLKTKQDELGGRAAQGHEGGAGEAEAPCGQRRSAGDPGGGDTRCDARNPAAIHTISRSRRTSE